LLVFCFVLVDGGGVGSFVLLFVLVDGGGVGSFVLFCLFWLMVVFFWSEFAFVTMGLFLSSRIWHKRLHLQILRIA
jgi:hypothetical protein